MEFYQALVVVSLIMAAHTLAKIFNEDEGFKGYAISTGVILTVGAVSKYMS